MPDFDALSAGPGGSGATSTTASATATVTTASAGGAGDMSASSTASSTAESSSSSSASTSNSSSSGGVVFKPITYTFETGVQGFGIPFAVPADWKTSVVPTTSDGDLVATVPFSAGPADDAGTPAQELQLGRDLGGANWTGAKTIEFQVQLQTSGDAPTGIYAAFVQSSSTWGAWLSIGYADIASAPAGMPIKLIGDLSTASSSFDPTVVQRIGIQLKNGAGPAAAATSVTLTLISVKVY